MDILENFREILDEYGVDSKETGKSLAVEFCPECDRNKFKVLFRSVDVDEEQPLFGRCQSGSCGKNYSSISYLIKLGVPRGEVLHAHGKNPEETLRRLNINNEAKDVKKVKKEESKRVVDVDISSFYPVDSFPNNAVSKYAIKRGYTPVQKDSIMIDTKYSAVVFVCRSDDSKVIGYQRRFMIVTGSNSKTKNSDGFITSENIMRFKNDGPIVICEGPFTALSAWHWGFDAIATFGSGAGTKQLGIITYIIKDENKRVLVARENDEAGIKYFNKIATALHWDNIAPGLILPEHGDDLNDSWQAGKKYKIESTEDINPALPRSFDECLFKI